MSLLCHIDTHCAYTYAYTPVSTMLQDNVMQLSKLLLTGLLVFQHKDTGRMCGRVTRCSIICFVTAGLWPQSGYRGGHVSETKGSALTEGRPL